MFKPFRAFFLGRPPFWMVSILLVSVVASWLPLAVFLCRRVSTSEVPPIHIVQDMAKQPKYRSQRPSLVFADGRADRPAIPGTVAHGQSLDEGYVHGFVMKADKPEFLTSFPKEIVLSEAFVRRGQTLFGIYCSACHGMDGSGHGRVNERAIELGESTWVQAANLTSDPVRERANGHIFNTITNGIRNMPAHGPQIAVADRWAIVAYVRALQLSQNAPAKLAEAK